MEDNKLDKTSTSSISTASTDISTEQKNNNKVSIDKLLNKKQQDQRTEKKQTPLEKYLDDYAKTLENKSPEDLEKERNKLEQQKKMSLIASIIFAILALVLLITACILLPLAPALVIAILSAIGAITAVASGIIDYNITNKKIDRVNVKKSQLYWQKKTPLRGNNKTPSASIRPNNSNTKITTTEKNIANNNSAGKEDTKKHANSINNNILKDQGNTNNINNNLNFQKNNTYKNNIPSNTNSISNNVTADKKSNIIGNNTKNDNGNINNNKNKITTNNVDTKQNQATVASDSSNNIVNSKVATSNDKDTNMKSAMFDKNKINIPNNQQQKANVVSQTKNKTTNDEQEAEKVRQDTLQSILNGTLDLSDRPKSPEEYEQCRNALKTGKTQKDKAINQQQMIKYEIWNQLLSADQENYDRCIKNGKTPEQILEKNIHNDTTWQINVYNRHLEKEEQKNQSFLGAIWNALKFEKTIQEKRQAVTTAILGQQQKNGIQLSGVGKQTGNNYNSGAITNENMKTQVKKI